MSKCHLKRRSFSETRCCGQWAISLGSEVVREYSVWCIFVLSWRQCQSVFTPSALTNGAIEKQINRWCSDVHAVLERILTKRTFGVKLTS